MTAFYEDREIGEVIELGAHTFTTDEIVAFASKYDPQRFHMSEEGAADSHFGRLCASGWHTAAVWMRLFIDHHKSELARAEADGLPIAKLGPSPGFTDLVWKLPVYVGDTITYRSTLTSKRVSASRPAWGLLTNRNEGLNQDGQLVYGFTGNVFVERRLVAT
ncbi:MAG: MaoC family dehydratase [Pseudomonadota bacterium]